MEEEKENKITRYIIFSVIGVIILLTIICVYQKTKKTDAQKLQAKVVKTLEDYKMCDITLDETKEKLKQISTMMESYDTNVSTSINNAIIELNIGHNIDDLINDFK